MNRPVYPSESYTCRRCGLARVKNAGLKRKARDTGLCKDCFDSMEWTCPVCTKTMRYGAMGIHLHHSHNLRKEDLP